MRNRLPWIFCVLLLPLAACRAPEAERLTEQYLARLATATAQPPPRLAEVALPRYPRARHRRAPVPDVRGGLLDFFRFPDCEIAELLGERNSILGRHADAATLLGNGGALVARLRQCRPEPGEASDGGGPLAERRQRINRIIAAKAPALEALAWNASFGSEAMARWWRHAEPPAGAKAAARGKAAAKALEALLGAQQAALAGADPSGHAYSAPWQALERDRYGGAWLRAVSRALQTLEAATGMLQAVEVRKLCTQEHATAPAQLRTVFRKHYLGGLQPWLAGLEYGMRPVSVALEALWEAQPLGRDVPAVAAVGDFRSRVWRPSKKGGPALPERLRTASRAHAKAWQELLSHCGMQAAPLRSIEPGRATVDQPAVEAPDVSF